MNSEKHGFTIVEVIVVIVIITILLVAAIPNKWRRNKIESILLEYMYVRFKFGIF